MNPIQENVIFNAETDDFNKSLVDLRKELRHLRGVMTEVERGTDEYNEALKRASEIQSYITDLNRDVRNSYVDLETGLANVGKAAGSVVRSMNALQGITNLVAGENNVASESIEKMMSMMALASGLSGISGMINNFKTLNVTLKSSTVVTKGLTAVQRVYNQVLKANPIFGLVAVIMAVVAGIGALTAALISNNKSSEELNATLEHQKRLREENVEKMEYQLRLMKALGATEEEVTEQSIENTRKQIEANNAEIQALWHKVRQYNIFQRGKSRRLKKEIEELEKHNQELLELEEKLLEDLSIIRAVDEDKEKKEKEANRTKEKQDQEEAKRREIQRQEDAKIKQQEYLQSLRDDINAHYEEKRRKAKSDEEREIEDIERHYEELIMKAEELGEEGKEIAAKLRMEKTDALMDINQKYLDLETEQTLEQNEKLNEARLQRIADEQEEADIKRAIREAEIKHQMDLLDATSDMLYGISQLMSEHTIGYKALASATVVIDTLKGIMGIWSGVKDPLFSTSLATIQSTALGVMGAANLKQILSVNPTGENNPSKLANAGKPTGKPKIASPTSPSFDNSINFIRQAQTQEEIDMQGQPVKAYVVETELREVSDRVDQTEQESSF